MAELAKLKRMNRPKVGEVDLDHWEEAAEDPQHLEIIRLARVGLWAEVHSVEIDDGLRLAGKELPTARRRAFENALSKRPRR